MLAVLVESNQRVIHYFFHRDAATHAGGVGAFRQNPLGLRINAGFLEQNSELHARPFGAGDLTVNLLNPDLCGLLLVEQLTVTATFDEGNARLHRIARQVFERED